MEAVYLLLGLIIWALQIMATVVCFRKQSPQWLKICGGVGTIIFMLAFIGATM